MLDLSPPTRLDADSRPDHRRCGSRRVGWAVIHTHPQAERWAASNLTRQGYQAWLPLRTILRPDRHTPTLQHRVAVPLFSSYLFVQIRSPFWAPISHTLGVNRILMSGPIPYILPEAAVSTLQAAADFSAAHMPDGRHWASGDACTPRMGVFLGHPAVVMEVADETVRIGLMFLGELRQIVMPIDCITTRTD